MHVLAARVGRGDLGRLRAGVPVVDRAVVLDARVGALPGRLRDAAEQLLRVDGVDDLAGLPGAQAELTAASTACMNSSVTRTELFAFWYCTEAMSRPPRSMSNPASRSTRILASSLALVCTNSSMSGWSTSSTTILAARRVAPPDLMVPALASAPRMNETGPDAVPPEDSSSLRSGCGRG